MATEPLIELGSNYELDEDTNGNLVIRDQNGNAALTYDDANTRWELAQDIVPETSGTEQLGATGKAFGQLVSNAVGNDGSSLSVDDDLDLQSAQSITNASSVSADLARINKRLNVSQSNLQVSSNSIPYQSSYVSVEGEGRNADNLDNITGGQNEGDLIILRAAAENITLRHTQGGAGELHLEGGASKTLRNAYDRIILTYNAFNDSWVQTTSLIQT
jgi:hypothetical protein